MSLNQKQVEIIPAILTNDLVEIKTKLQLLEGITNRIQIDIIDGIFADNKTVSPQHLLGIDTGFSLDYHLMVKEPIKWVESCASSGADRIIGQIESMSSQIDFVAKITQIGLGVGLAIDLDTPVEKIEKTILTDVDVILVLGVKAGFGGQRFHPSCLEKIVKLNKIRQWDNSPFRICADGGETLETIDDVVSAGVDEIVIGRRLFQGDVDKNIEKFVKASLQ